MEKTDPNHCLNDIRYSKLPKEVIPDTESLKTTVERVVPYWNGTIVPSMKEGNRIIICAHGNSIRALVKYLDNISDSEITSLNIPNGTPLIYELDENMKPLKNYYL